MASLASTTDPPAAKRGALMTSECISFQQSLVPVSYSMSKLPAASGKKTGILTLDTIGCAVTKKSSDLKIVGTYKEDYNIRSLHNKVVRLLTEKSSILIEELSTEEKDIKAKLRVKTRFIELKPLLKRLRQIKKQLQSIDGEAILREFYKRAEPLLERYASIGPLHNQIKVGEVLKNEYVLRTEEHDIRLNIIADYIAIASEYIDIDITREVDGIEYCTTCGLLLEDDEEDDNGYLFCPQCKVQIPTFYNSSEYTENNLKYNIKNTYFNKETFLEEFMRIQGKETVTLPENYKQRLDEHFSGMTPSPIGDIVKQWPLCEDGSRLGTTRKMMIDALKEIGMNKYYGHVYKICHEYWGWVLWNFDNDFSNSLLEDYNIQQRVLLTIPTNKTSAINVQYNLHWLLRKKGVKCRPSHFKIPKTPEILQDYERRRRAACNILMQHNPEWACPWSITENDLEV